MLDDLEDKGPPLVVYPRLVRIAGDLPTAVLLCYLAGEHGWVRLRSNELEMATGLSRRAQARARERLVALGLLDEKREGKPPIVAMRAKAAPLRRAWKRGRTIKGAIVAEDKIARHNETPEETARRAIAGEFDGLPQTAWTSPRMMRAALWLWAASWGKNQAAVVLTDGRKAAMRKAARAGLKPSLFFRSIIGMTHDDWLGRDDHCEWNAVVEYHDRWLLQYTRANGEPALRPAALGFAVKVVDGVTVPVGYRWDSADDYCRGKGERFDPRIGRWVNRSHPAYRELSVISPPRRKR